MFRLEQVFDDVFGALLLQKQLANEREVTLKRTEDGRWAVYWRSKKKRVECVPSLQSAS
ncbi:MAG: hypothetical protein ACE5H4_13085 [Candidatus Thorarchaeota archaeon]